MEPTPSVSDGAGSTEDQGSTPAGRRSPVAYLRAVVSALLVAVAVLAACAAVLAYWVDSVLLDTDTFITAVEPIVGDDAVREQASDAIAAAVIETVDVRALADAALAGAESSLVDEIVGGFETLVGETVSSAVRTDAFEDLWVTEMRVWHVKLVGAVKAPEAEYAADGTVVRVTLGPYIELLVEQADNLFAQRLIMALVPDSVRQMQVVVFDAQLVENRLPLLRSLESWRPYLPWIAAFALLLALIAAPRASYAMLGAGIAVAAGGGVAWMMARAEAARIASLTQSTFSASQESATTFAGTLFGPLETWLVDFALAGTVVAALSAIVVWSVVWRSRRRGKPA